MHDTLFLGDLSSFTTEPMLVEVFKAFGEIAHVRVKCGCESKKTLGYGFIRFAKCESAAAAKQAMNGYILQGRALRIGWAARDRSQRVAPPKPETAQILASFIAHNANYLVTEQVLRNIFSRYGRVIDATIKKSQIDPDSRSQNGYGFVHFALSDEGIQESIRAVRAMNDVIIDGISYDCRLSDSLLLRLRGTQYHQYAVASPHTSAAVRNNTSRAYHQVNSGGNGSGGGHPQFFNGPNVPHGPSSAAADMYTHISAAPSMDSYHSGSIDHRMNDRPFCAAPSTDSYSQGGLDSIFSVSSADSHTSGRFLSVPPVSSLDEYHHQQQHHHQLHHQQHHQPQQQRCFDQNRIASVSSTDSFLSTTSSAAASGHYSNSSGGGYRSGHHFNNIGGHGNCTSAGRVHKAPSTESQPPLPLGRYSYLGLDAGTGRSTPCCIADLISPLGGTPARSMDESIASKTVPASYLRQDPSVGGNKREITINTQLSASQDSFDGEINGRSQYFSCGAGSFAAPYSPADTLASSAVSSTATTPAACYRVAQSPSSAIGKPQRFFGAAADCDFTTAAGVAKPQNNGRNQRVNYDSAIAYGALNDDSHSAFPAAATATTTARTQYWLRDSSSWDEISECGQVGPMMRNQPLSSSLSLSQSLSQSKSLSLSQSQSFDAEFARRVSELRANEPSMASLQNAFATAVIHDASPKASTKSRYFPAHCSPLFNASTAAAPSTPVSYSDDNCRIVD